jgi:hypothetical protein
MSYEVWSKVSRSIVGAFPTKDDALAAVREANEAHGRKYAEDLALIYEDRRGRSRAIAEGLELVERALAGSNPRPKIPA